MRPSKWYSKHRYLCTKTYQSFQTKGGNGESLLSWRDHLTAEENLLANFRAMRFERNRILESDPSDGEERLKALMADWLMVAELSMLSSSSGNLSE